MLKTIRDLNIQAKLLLTYSLLILFPTLALGVLTYVKLKDSIEKDAGQFNIKLISQINRNLDNTILEMDRISLSSLTDPDIYSSLKKLSGPVKPDMINIRYVMSEKLKGMIKQGTGIKGIFIYPKAGESYGETFFYAPESSGMRSGYNIMEEAWYKKVIRENGGKVLLCTHRENQIINGGNKVFSLVRELNDIYNYKEKGIILVDADLKVIQDICDNSNIGREGKIIIADQEGNIVFHTDEEQEGGVLDKELLAIKNMKDGNLKTRIGSKNMLVSFNTSEYTGWTVFGIIPVEYLDKNVYIIRNTTVFISILCLALGLTVSVFIARGISNPIKKLKKLMKEAEKGNLEVRSDYDSRDEVGQLSNSFNIMIFRIKELINKVYEGQIMQKEAELKALQNQINPHFLYNTLETVRGLALANGATSIVHICKALAKLFRYNIDTGRESVMLSEEIEHVRNYIQVQKYRYKDRFDVVYDIDETISQSKVIKFILQPIIENSIYHGMDMKLEKGEIKIAAERAGEDIIIRVSDDGTGMSQEQVHDMNEVMQRDDLTAGAEKRTRSSGIGIFNVNSRIRLFYGKSYGLYIESSYNKGTTVVIRIPANYQEEQPC